VKKNRLLHTARTARSGKKNQYTIVLYKEKFEKESSVEIKIVFQEIGGKNLVSGLCFNSLKLRQ